MLPWLQTELYSETCMNLYLIFYRCFFSVWSSLSTINPRFITFANKEPQKAWFRSPGGYKAYRVLRLRCDANILNSIWFTWLIVNALTTLLARRLFIHCHSIQFCQLTVTRYSPGVPPVTGQILGVPGVPSFLAHSERFWGSNAGGSTIQIEFLGLVGPCMSYLWSPNTTTIIGDDKVACIGGRGGVVGILGKVCFIQSRVVMAGCLHSLLLSKSCFCFWSDSCSIVSAMKRHVQSVSRFFIFLKNF